MSDHGQGAGWWQASNGKWYPPNLYPPLSSPPPPSGSGKPWWQKPWVLLGAAVLLLVGGVGIGAVLATGDDRSETVTSEEETARTTAPPRTTTTVDVEALRTAYSAKVNEGCAAAARAPLSHSHREAAEAQGTGFDLAWLPVATREGFVAVVEACAAPHRDARIRSECTVEAPVELLNRDPNQFYTQCFTLVVTIVQYDQGTGPCTFRARFDTELREYSFEYRGENALVKFDQPCPDLNPVGNEDVLRIRAVVLGGIDYETTIGGKTSAVGLDALPGFEVLQNK